MVFGILFAIDALAALAIVYFFVAGLADGSVSSFNMGLWAAILLAVAAVLGGGWALRSAGRRIAANLVLAVLAAPALLYLFFIAVVILSGARWN